MSYPTSYGLGPVPAKLLGGVDLLFQGDSFSYAEQSGAARFPDQIINGVPMAPINGIIGNAIDSTTQVLQLETADSHTGVTGGTNYEDIATGNNYRIGGQSSATDHWGVPTLGAALYYDANLTLGTNGLVAECKLRKSSDAPVWKNANSVNNMNVYSLVDANGFKVRPIYVTFSDAKTHSWSQWFYDGVTGRWATGGSQGTARSLRTQAKGKRLNDEDPDTDIVAPDYGHANALQDTIVKLEYPASSGNSTFFWRSGTAVATPNTSRSLNIVGLVVYRIDADGDFIGSATPSTVAGWVADGSWTTGGFGADAASSSGTPKQFTQTQYAHWLDSVTIDESRDMVIFWSFDPEANSAATTKANCLASMASVDDSCDDVGRPRPYHVWIGPHLTSLGTTHTNNTNQGYYEAVLEHGNAGFYSIYQATENIDFGSSDATTQAFIDSKLPSGVLSFGTKSSTDITAATLLSDNVHPTENGAAFFMKLMYDQMLADANAALYHGIRHPIGSYHGRVRKGIGT